MARRVLIMVAAASLLAAPALAQGTPPATPPISPGNAGVDPGTTKPKEVEVPERGSLPAAGGATQSAAPGMNADCTKDPSACSEPVQQTGSVPPGMPPQSK